MSTAATEKAGSHEHTELETTKSGEPQHLTFWQKVKKHVRRWWWLHLILVICITLVIVLPIIFVGVRNIVQSKFNKGTLDLISESASDPDPESFQLRLVTEQYSHTSFTPVIEPFNASLSLPGSNKPFLYFTTPQLQTESAFNVTVDQRVTIADMEEFTKYNEVVFRNETVNVQVVGRPKVSLKGLPKYTVTYSRLASQKGLNGLPVFELVDLKLLQDNTTDNATVTQTLLVNNPTVLTVEMGTLTEDLYSAVNGTYLGYVNIENFTLRPGNNCFPVRGFINITQITSYITAGNILPLIIKGNRSVNAAGQELPYYSKVLQDTVYNYTLNLTEAVMPPGEGQCKPLT